MTITIGLDFDNTIVSYDMAIKKLADEKFGIRNSNLTKNDLKKQLIQKFGEDEWTKFQGYLYGPGMEHAIPYKGSVEVIEKLHFSGKYKLLVISHRTTVPFLGEKYALHTYARNWIKQHTSLEEILGQEAINFFDTKEKKIRAIAENNCDFFLDDLPEILTHNLFPKFTTGILFEPVVSNEYSLRISNWSDLVRFVR